MRSIPCLRSETLRQAQGRLWGTRGFGVARRPNHDEETVMIGAPGCGGAWRQERARRFFRRRSGLWSRRRPSMLRWVLCQTGTACTSSLRPFGVRVIRRARPSVGSGVILTRPRRWRGLRAAVRVVRSIASSDATAAMPVGSGRLRDIMSENWPFVRSRGRSASSKRRASALAARWR